MYVHTKKSPVINSYNVAVRSCHTEWGENSAVLPNGHDNKILVIKARRLQLR